MPTTHVTVNLPRRTARDVRASTTRDAALAEQVRQMSRCMVTDADFKEGDHPRAANGQFGSGAVHENLKKGSAPKEHFEKHGVTGEHEIHVVSRASGRYDGVKKIDDLVAKNGGNRAKTLTDLKWDHDQGRIQYKAPNAGASPLNQSAPAKSAAPIDPPEEPTTAERKPGVRKVGALELHPAGEDYAGRKRFAVHRNGEHVGHVQETVHHETHMQSGSRIATHRTEKVAYKAHIKSEHEKPGAFLSRFYPNAKQAAEAIERNLK